MRSTRQAQPAGRRPAGGSVAGKSLWGSGQQLSATPRRLLELMRLHCLSWQYRCPSWAREACSFDLMGPSGCLPGHMCLSLG